MNYCRKEFSRKNVEIIDITIPYKNLCVCECVCGLEAQIQTGYSGCISRGTDYRRFTLSVRYDPIIFFCTISTWYFHIHRRYLGKKINKSGRNHDWKQDSHEYGKRSAPPQPPCTPPHPPSQGGGLPWAGWELETPFSHKGPM